MHLSFNFRNFNIHINITEHIFIMVLYTQIQHIQQMQYIQYIQYIQHIQYTICAGLYNIYTYTIYTICAGLYNKNMFKEKI